MDTGHRAQLVLVIAAAFFLGGLVTSSVATAAPICNPFVCNGAVTNTLNYLLDRVISTADPNYRVYCHTGACHAEPTADGNGDPSCDHDRVVQHGVLFRDWVRDWIDDRPDWSNVR